LSLRQLLDGECAVVDLLLMSHTTWVAVVDRLVRLLEGSDGHSTFERDRLNYVMVLKLSKSDWLLRLNEGGGLRVHAFNSAQKLVLTSLVDGQGVVGTLWDHHHLGARQLTYST